MGASMATVRCCCWVPVPVLWIRIHFFPDPEFFGRFRVRIRILRLPVIFWHDNFLKSGSQCVHIYSETCKTEKKFCYRKNQCCGSELIFFGFGFGSTNYFFFRIRIRIRILRLIFWAQIFLNGASDCFHMCSGTCTSEKKKLSIEKHRIFLFQVFDFWFFTKMFILQQCLNPNPYPNPNFLFGFGFGSSQNIRIISDSDPQHWKKHTFCSLTSF
jgi:hypothetical protein